MNLDLESRHKMFKVGLVYVQIYVSLTLLSLSVDRDYFDRCASMTMSLALNGLHLHFKTKFRNIITINDQI
jgi:hypothetical protein